MQKHPASAELGGLTLLTIIDRRASDGLDVTQGTQPPAPLPLLERDCIGGVIQAARTLYDQ
ncbi:hypothetical protein [Caulobacter sp. UNC279MFTsu5.1]|uniref:hypothetical protein n=1 Tax=Caulobacter sp. UNC279MFTsu5.1 TaxID=1502775 RepID=UPI0003773E93|nr:hypothetical protein [Caulobacter sp. UNC279MFTsu5.1]